MNRHKLNWTEFPKFQSQNNATEYYYIITNEEEESSVHVLLYYIIHVMTIRQNDTKLIIPRN